ncbi:(Lyso)-N-acylphosphatidylethanolamine lipase-like [Glandiceps talaboti]
MQRSNSHRTKSSCQKFKWVPTSETALKTAEERILRHVKADYDTRFVSLGKNQGRLYTAVFNPTKSTKTPFVFVHGFASGLGLWALNIDRLCEQRPFYAFDLLGFGRSSRPKFPENEEACEELFVESIETWRTELKLDKMILVGHSFGGYLVSNYAMKYPERIQHLILVDPWGFPETPSLVRKLGSFFVGKNGSLLGLLRAAGPYGPDLMKKGRRDIREKYSALFDDNTVPNYIFHCNARNPTGERAFTRLLLSLGKSIQPMIRRIHKIHKDVPMTFIYGKDTYPMINTGMGETTQQIRKGSHVDVHLVTDASHQVYADQPHKFNWLMLRICEDIP